MIKVVDYGLGNVAAFLSVFKRLNVQAAAAKTVAELGEASKLLLPGVGAFDHAIELLERSGMREALEARVMGGKVPLLGVCVGMQILGDASDEGKREGLGWISGRVRAFASLGNAELVLPHMGWNDVEPSMPSPLFKGLERQARFYFLHSYYFECRRRESSLAESAYGLPFSAAIGEGNVFGVQFHPEKSHRWGTQLLKNFAEL